VWGKEKINAVGEIQTVIKYVAETYLTEDEARSFTDPSTGISRRLERATALKDGPAFKAALNDYNKICWALLNEGAIAKNLESMNELPRHLVAFIMQQVYDRTVAPQVDILKEYKNGSDNVYGELLHPFISNILVDRLSMTSDQVFVDLGSGVGNVVLQAALEIGCESWGCEMMENACNLAALQKEEFSARCQLWGLAPGRVRLERGDFRYNKPILEALKRADVVLVNNQAFTSQLNDDLVRIFLDLKPGCKVVSLKNFVKSSAHKTNDLATNILDVEELTYPEEWVSWTSAAGSFCISTRK
jgi:H3 lysine-79-specific histone-lysine N-methyltransferase